MELLAQLLHAARHMRHTPAKSGAEARRLLLEGSFDLIVINAPLPDEFGHELACWAAQTSTAGVLLLVRSESADDLSARVEDEGVFVVPKPVNRPFFYQALKLVSASRRRMLNLEQQNMKLQQKIEEIRLVDRAKCTLIEVLKLSEAQAHRYIEKQAMDMRITRREVAENILKTYES